MDSGKLNLYTKKREINPQKIEKKTTYGYQGERQEMDKLESGTKTSTLLYIQQITNERYYIKSGNSS